MYFIVIIIIVVRLNVVLQLPVLLSFHSDDDDRPTHNTIVDNTCIEFVRQEMFIIPKHIWWDCFFHHFTHSLSLSADTCFHLNDVLSACALCAPWKSVLYFPLNTALRKMLHSCRFWMLFQCLNTALKVQFFYIFHLITIFFFFCALNTRLSLISDSVKLTNTRIENKKKNKLLQLTYAT